MAIDQLGLYNDALLLVGQRIISNAELVAGTRESVRVLDGVYGRNAIDYCLELVKPNFATKTTVLNSPAAGTTFAYSHSLPADHICPVGVFSDADLDQEVNRYIIEDRVLKTDYAVVYLRHVTNGYALADWDASFTRVVGAFLAREIVLRLNPDALEAVNATFEMRVKSALDLEKTKVPKPRPSSSTTTLTNSMRALYNDALMIMGLEELTSNSDDSNRRVKLDKVLDGGLVAALLEDTGWTFGLTSTQIDYDPSAEPEWGYRRAIPKPNDLHRLDGIYHDEYLKSPLKAYADDHPDYWFCDLDTVFIQYITTSFVNTPDAWPRYFKRLVAAGMAKDAAMSLRQEGADPEWCDQVFKERESAAKSTDAMISPPRVLASGSWVQSRFRSNSRNRP